MMNKVKTCRRSILHADVNDTMLPLSVVLSSASVHDSQVAIPLIKLTSAKVRYCYDLMDAAYDARQIREQRQALGHVAIIDRNPRQGDALPMCPHEAKRYSERSSEEHFNGCLKEEYGGRNIMVRQFFFIGKPSRLSSLSSLTFSCSISFVSLVILIIFDLLSSHHHLVV
jgi:hypothetical protein